METNVTIRYAGPALDAGRMSVYEASANMIAFSEFMVAAVKSTYGDNAEAKAEVRGFEHGSFVTSLIFSVVGPAASIFTSLTPTELWSVVKGSFALWKHLKGQPPARVENNGNSCSVTNNSGQIIQVRTESLTLVLNDKASQPVERFIKEALEREGYDSVEISAAGGEEITRVDRTEAPSFVSVARRSVLSDNSVRMVVQIVAAVFQDGNKWRFSDGGSTFSAAILDGDFIVRVDKGERFGKGDVLDVEMRIIQAADGLKTNVERTVLKVHGHRTPHEQIALS